jgi:exonuclease SbcD
VGGAASVPPGVFAGVDLLALGHLHQPQVVGEHGRYAGSPVPLSFSEAHHAKSVALVELGDGAPRVQLAPVPGLRPLRLLRGTLDELLADPALADAAGAWVHVTLTDPVRPQDAMGRLRARFPHAVVLAFEPHGAGPEVRTSYGERVRGLDDAALLARFVEDVRGTGADAEEQALLEDALTAGRVAELTA